MRVLFVTPQLGSWATHGHHVAPNQMHAQWAAYAREKRTIDGRSVFYDGWFGDLDL
jgi:hypothetical protein